MTAPYKMFNGKRYEWVHSTVTKKGALSMAKKYKAARWSAKIIQLPVWHLYGYAIYARPYGK